MFKVFTSMATHRRPFYLNHLLFVVFLLLVPLTLAHGQGVGAGRELGGTGGNHVITGRIYFPTQPTGDIRVKVRLESTSAPGLSTMTNADGVFRFSGLNTGYYTIIIDAGEQFEIFRERVDIERGNTYSPRTVQIPIHLRLKASGSRTITGTIPAIPKAPVDLYDKALASAQKGDHKKAIEHLNAAIAIHPNFALALNELGVQYLKLGQPDKAAAALETAVKLAPEEFYPRLNYGIALLNQRNFAQSEEQLRLALKMNNAAPTAHMYLGIALMSQQKLDDAEKELQMAANSNSHEVATTHRYLGGIFWGKRDYKRAADELETYLKLVPKAADAERTRAAIKDLRSKQ